MYVHTKYKVTGPCSQMPNSSNHQHKSFKGKAASQNMAQTFALAANEASSTAAVQGKADHSLCIASIPTARMMGPTNSF